MILLMGGSRNHCIRVRPHIALMVRCACMQPTAATPDKRQRHKLLFAVVNETELGHWCFPRVEKRNKIVSRNIGCKDTFL